MFCRETVRLLKRIAGEDADYPPVTFVHQGSVEQGDDFFERFWPEASAIADPERRLFEAFALKRGSFRQVLGLGSLASGIRAAFRGNGVGKPVGDVRQMPGAFLIHEGRILWSHDFRHAGDHPDYRAVPERLGDARLSDAPAR